MVLRDVTRCRLSHPSHLSNWGSWICTADFGQQLCIWQNEVEVLKVHIPWICQEKRGPKKVKHIPSQTDSRNGGLTIVKIDENYPQQTQGSIHEPCVCASLCAINGSVLLHLQSSISAWLYLLRTQALLVKLNLYHVLCHQCSEFLAPATECCSVHF